MERSSAPGPRRGPSPSENVLEVENLTCSIDTPDGPVRLVNDVSFTLRRGATLGIVGESASGKTMLVRSIMGIAPREATVTGRVVLDGVDIRSLPPAQRRRLLGAGIGMIFQNPVTSLNPVVPIGRQITEGLRYHRSIGRRAARDRAVSLLEQVGISDPAKRMKQYPYQLSGGMRQRVTIAAALACDPGVLIADEATTALDVTVQKQILDLIKQIQADRNMSVIIISHDLGVVAGRSDNVAVMYSAEIVEAGPTAELFARHRHQYTTALLNSIPELDGPVHGRLATIPGSPRRATSDATGCPFAQRCSAATDKCRETNPPPRADDGSATHWFRCHWPRQADAGGPGNTHLAPSMPAGRS